MQRSRGSPTANSGAGAGRFSSSARPTVMGLGGVVSTGHYLATAAGALMLERGGNAVDAGVAAGLVLNVVHNDMNTLSGVAPIIVYLADENRTLTLPGVGRWPLAIDRDHLLRRYNGMPDTLERCVVPAAAASWLTALRDYGTMSFAAVSEPARRYAADGFPVHTFMNHAVRQYIETYRRWDENRKLFLVDGEAPPVGTVIRQPDLHRTLERMVEAERVGSPSGRRAGVQAVIDYFYRGPIAEKMVAFAQAHGGALTLADMDAFSVPEMDPVTCAWGEWTVAACGPWSQGPTLPMSWNILRNFDLAAMGHNSPEYIHTVASALDLAFADRNAYCGDPAFVDVPMDALLAPEYGELRAGLIRDRKGCSTPANPGDPIGMRAEAPERQVFTEHFGAKPSPPPADTSCVTAADRYGNFFAATPSDGYCNGPIIPGLGLHISERGSQSFFTKGDPNVIEPGKRPRLTPNPVLIFRNGKPFAAMATPGNDRQVQAMLQVFLNMAVFGMTPQQAVEAPRFASYNFRASTWPGNTEPGRLRVEAGIDPSTRDVLADWGRDVAPWPAWCWSAGGVSLSLLDEGVFQGAADPRREGYAIAL